MKYAADFRSIAKNTLSGRWTTAVIAGLLASLLGAITENGPKINYNISNNGADFGLEFAGQQVLSTSNGWNEHLLGFFAGGVSIALVVALITGIAFFILGSVISLGYSRFNLDLVDRRNDPEIGTLFGYFTHWKTAAAANLLQTLYVLLWSLLFVFPGIIASYSYAMTGYILAEHPELSASEAIERSKEMMTGNRFRLFCLNLSFIGWDILCALTLGIGNLWLTPYKQAATAAFYREVSGTEYILNSTN